LAQRIQFLVALLGAATAGCATVVHGTSQRIPITSSPVGAQVLVDSVPVGVTPLVATVSRRRSHEVTVVQDGVGTVRLTLDRNISPWVLANSMLSFVPAIVDVADGGAYGFRSDTVRANLSAPPRTERPAPFKGIRRTSPIPTESRVTATTASIFIGFGSGHALIGARARPFLLTQLGGTVAAASGLALVLGGKNVGGPLWVGGSALLIGSRLFEVIDIVSTTAKYNSRF